jgi:hypothetical protein
MAQNFCSFINANTKKEVLVNVSLIRDFQEFDIKTVLIAFDSEHMLTVVGTLWEVAKKIKDTELA